MQLVLFIGIQATGKSTFYRTRFSETHLRLNLDMLKTRHREKLLFQACIESKTPVVVDNTNLTAAERAVYVSAAQAAGFETTGYYFASRVSDSLLRNAARDEKVRVPDLAILGSKKRLELPTLQEGFNHLYFVQLQQDLTFSITPWNPT